MVLNTSRTIYGVMLQNAVMLGQPYVPLVNTTLNEKFDILSIYDITDKYPTVNLLTIGVGGSEYGLPQMNIKRSVHSPKDGALFNHIPFFVREGNYTLTKTENQRYRLVKQVIHNDVVYTVAYGLVLNNFIYENKVYQLNSITNNYNYTEYKTQYDSNILNPVNNGYVDLVNSDTGKYLICTSSIIIDFTSKIIEEIMHAMDVFNNGSYVINEMGLAASVEVELENGLLENVSTQMTHFIDVNYDVSNYKDNGININLDIGGSEPFVLTTS